MSEQQRIDDFELLSSGGLVRFSCTAESKWVNPKVNQLCWFTVKTEAEGVVNVLTTLTEENRHWSLENVDSRRSSGWERMRSLDSITDSKDLISERLWEKVRYRESWCAAVQEVMKSQTWLSDWTITAFQFVKWAFQGWGLGPKISEE